MNIQRLKFAWARGARIQYWNPRCYGWKERATFEESGDYPWTNAEDTTNWFHPWYAHCPKRIHPDDEHLAYGPVATAFRDMALFTDYTDDLPEIVTLFEDLAGSNYLLEGSSTDNVVTDFTRLFFAEYLADEGL